MYMRGKRWKKKCSTVLIQLWINYILFNFSLEKVTRAMFMFRRRTNLNSDLLLCIWWTSLRLQVFVYCCHWLPGISTFSWTNKVGFTMTSFLPLLLFSYQIPWCINCQFAKLIRFLTRWSPLVCNINVFVSCIFFKLC